MFDTQLAVLKPIALKPEHRKTHLALQLALRSLGDKEATSIASVEFVSGKQPATLSRALYVASCGGEIRIWSAGQTGLPSGDIVWKKGRACEVSCALSDMAIEAKAVSHDSESTQESLLAEAAVWRALRRLRSLDQYELSGVTGLPLSVVKRAIRSLLSTGEVREVADGPSARFALGAAGPRLSR